MKSVKIVAGCVMVCAVLIAMGCQTTHKPTDEEILAGLTQQCMAAAKAGDVDKMMTFYSDKFTNPQFGDKMGMKKFLDDAKQMGYLDKLDVDLSQAKTIVKGPAATVAPVNVRGSFGSITINFSTTKEKDGWKITGMEADM